MEWIIVAAAGAIGGFFSTGLTLIEDLKRNPEDRITRDEKARRDLFTAGVWLTGLGSLFAVLVVWVFELNGVPRSIYALIGFAPRSILRSLLPDG